MPQQVGFSMRIKLEWLEQTAFLVASGQERDEVKAFLEDFLADKLSGTGKANRGNRQKAITILLKTWATVPEELEPMRDEGLSLLRELPASEHLAVHWGMTMAAYPFFGKVAETVGRYLRLQDHVSVAQVQRRMCELMGERETVARATRRVLRCFVDWGVLEDTETRGVSQATQKISLESTPLTAWLLEACLVATGSSSGMLKAIADTPALFPFQVSHVSPAILERNRRLEFFKQGLDEDIVTLRYGT
jgi:hypothetical protein